MKASLVPFAAGCLGGGLFVGALLLLDVGGIGTLIARDQAVFLPIFMLLVQLGGLFGMAVMLSSLMEEERADGDRQRVALSPLPAVHKPQPPSTSIFRRRRRA
ncbi:hypothetical protein [Dongia sedimenti]|uniref:Uncharacterized protein n=1 Tax=Dongia sedimenti TaxID=3064282 RepID=A0ABU0YMA2_9PROT|nr:hypothetical protein [Rhodospirillaceae bacterium R-7]